MRHDSMMAAILRGEYVTMQIGTGHRIMGDGIKSDVDGRIYHNRKDYDRHLADNGLAMTSHAENKSKIDKMLHEVRENDARTRATGDTGGCDPARLERLRAGLRE